MTTTGGTIVRRMEIVRRSARCPKCGELCGRHSIGTRTLRELGTSQPVVLEVKYSKHRCHNCQRFFNIPMEHLAELAGRYTNRVKRAAIDAYKCRTLFQVREHMARRYHVVVPPTTLHDWLIERETEVLKERNQ